MSCPDVYFYFPLSHVEFQLTGREQTVAGIKALRCNLNNKTFTGLIIYHVPVVHHEWQQLIPFKWREIHPNMPIASSPVGFYPVHTHCLLLPLMTSRTSSLQPSSQRRSSTSWLLHRFTVIVCWSGCLRLRARCLPSGCNPCIRRDNSSFPLCVNTIATAPATILSTTHTRKHTHTHNLVILHL